MKVSRLSLRFLFVILALVTTREGLQACSFCSSQIKDGNGGISNTPGTNTMRVIQNPNVAPAPVESSGSVTTQPTVLRGGKFTGRIIILNEKFFDTVGNPGGNPNWTSNIE